LLLPPAAQSFGAVAAEEDLYNSILPSFADADLQPAAQANVLPVERTALLDQWQRVDRALLPMGHDLKP
jgi:hypothetical protein